MTRKLQITALAMMVLLFPVYAFASSVLKMKFSISGLDRIGWMIGALFSYAVLVLAPAAKMYAKKKLRLDKLDVIGIVVLFCALWLYPFTVQRFCDWHSARRVDGQHWIKSEHDIYYFVEANYSDAFGGMIELYPPYFSLPKH